MDHVSTRGYGVRIRNEALGNRFLGSVVHANTAEYNLFYIEMGGL